ncbi:hypothetical protein I656_03547 [Geobacillus sp. WSUCF1]|nr:hypothetical protein I656_03547 [Geobacillus sp. WSUCF1]
MAMPLRFRLLSADWMGVWRLVLRGSRQRCFVVGVSVVRTSCFVVGGKRLCLGPCGALSSIWIRSGGRFVFLV